MSATLSSYLGIIEIYTFLFAFPFVLGLIIRLLCSKLKKFYFVSIGLLMLTIISFIIVSNTNTHGSEGPMLRVAQLASCTIGMLLAEGIRYFRRKLK